MWSSTFLDENGLPSFNTLQNHQTATTPILYYVFDVLASRGKSLLSVELEHRRDLMQAIAAELSDPIRLSGSLQADPADLVAAGKKQGLEGFLAKRRGSVYEPGRRTGAWVKYKIHKGQELVIGGYRVGPNGFDNVAVGYYEGSKLLFIAKVRNGFTPELRRKVSARFKGLESPTCPFANLPEPKNTRRGEALTAEAMKAYRWLKPRLVAEIDSPIGRTRRKRRRTTRVRRTEQNFQITHPFHPLAGREFEALARKEYGGEHRVSFLDKKGRQCEIPLNWTDLAPEDAFTTLSAGKSWFRAADLLELAQLIEGLRR
jgi:ATP-dependent DNA ligase